MMKEKIITRDGSITFKDEKTGDHYHSITIGALEEAREKYAKQVRPSDGMVCLDFCFGLGYNTLALFKILKRCEVIAIENDPKIIDAIRDIEVPTEYKDDYDNIKKSIFEKTVDENKRLKLIVSDARDALKNLPDNSFDAVMFDPFAPSKDSDLWTQEVFDEMARIMKKGARLATYSCAGHVREKLKNAGFEVFDGVCLGRRAPSTLAVKRLKTSNF